MFLDRRCGGTRVTYRQVIVGIAMSLLVFGITVLIVCMAGARAQNRLSDALAEPVHLGGDVTVSSLSAVHQNGACPRFQFSCGGNSSSCVKLKKRCDGLVDCPRGAADEVGCPCAFRLPPSKFCDGYPDCFDESDESFCSYCPKGYFNCEDGKCIPRTLICDSKVDCENFMDENFCFRLSVNATLPDSTSAVADPVDASSTKKSPPKSGFLLRNKKGSWYPVCANPSDPMQDALASFACVSMTANPLASSTHEFRTFPAAAAPYSGDYVYHYGGRFFRWGGCGTGRGLHVTCDDVRCGFNPRHLLPKRRRGRIVGGNTSDPGAWPWHGAVYKNGSYACGATLVSDRWLVSAAHCFVGYRTAYYEVQLGMLRRESFTPHQRTYRIDRVVVHRAFSIVTLEYDIALLRTSEVVAFDFWVRPICLPDRQGARPDDAPGSYCTAVGWGDTGEREDDSEVLKEVHVPLTKSCKRDLRRWLCAGYAQGGRDACQGDSGGALMCLREDGLSWYIAGIVSAGRGCARPGTPGMYTRVSYFLDWVRQVMTGAPGSSGSADVPLSTCPGWKCAAVGGGNCLSPERVCDGHVDCYDAQDEANCSAKTG